MSRFFDLYGAVQSNPRFVADVSRHFANIDKIEKKVGAAIASNSEDAAAELGAVYRKCAFNPGLLLPWFFPTAFNGQPLSLRTRPFAMALTSMNVGGSTTIRGSRQISKCFVKGSKIKIRNKKTGVVSEVTAEEALRLFEAGGKTTIPCVSQTYSPSEKTIVKEVTVSDYEVWSDEGWLDITAAFETAPMPVYELRTETHKIECADAHLLSTTSGLKYAKDITIFDTINTESGPEAATSVIQTDRIEPMYDFSVDSERHLYYVDGILSHNSSTLAARALVNAWLLKDWSAIYIAPHAEHQRTFNRKLAEMERMCRYHVKDPVLKQNLSYREFPTGSKIETAYVTSSASGIRGKTANEIDFDEFQQFDVNFLPEVEQVQKVPKLKATTYSGTSLTIETALEAKYQAGSCGRWMIKLGNGTYCDCTDPEQILQLFRPQGLTCPITSRPIDPTAGRFEHKYPERIEDGHVSLHIPQIIIPELATEPAQWRTLYQSFFDYKASGQLKKFLQEVLGIPTEEGAKELTEADVKRICVDSWTPDGMLKRVQQGYYKIIVSGVDWGGSDHNLADKTKLSFTFHMVLGVTQDNQLDILFMRKYAGCNYAQVINGIVNTNKLFHVRYIASDFSAGSHYNLNLRSQGGVAWNSHLVMQYGGNSNRFFVKANSELLNHYWLHKTDAISTVIEAIKQERPRIRCYNWELAKNDLFDLTHLYRSITTNATGRESFHYRRHSTKPDDGLHALTFAYTMARIVLGESLLEDKAAAQELYRTLGVVSPRPGVSYFPDAHSPNGLGGKLFTSG